MSEKRLIASSVLFAAIEEELQNHHQASFTITGMKHVAVSVSWAG